MSTRDHHFPCENCGSDMRYDPGTDRLICDHCGDTQLIGGRFAPPRALAELDLKTALDNHLPATQIEETRVTQCPSCGAQVELQDDTHALRCPFCATPVVSDTGTHRHIKPAGTLPFEITESAARKAMSNWLGRLWFAPSGLHDYARKGRRMDGIYVPYWTFDARTHSAYRGERGTVYYEDRTVYRDGERETVRVAKVRWTRVSGRVARTFDDILVLASQSLPKEHTDALQPWDLSRLEPYIPEYLAGFRAEGYSVELPDGFTEAQGVMGRTIARDVKFDIGGDRQRIHDINTRMSDVTFKHILLPVWVAAYKFRGKSYRFVVNGQTGQVRGERPWSVWKIALAVIFGLLVAAALGYLFAQNGGQIPGNISISYP